MKSNKIVDSKIMHLIKTLSRTRRKDYENYVINAIWQRLNNSDIEVVSQQYVENNSNGSGSSHYFIDLYFPALNIGIECDEAFHQKQSKKDVEREVKIYDIISKIREEDYEAIHIDVIQGFQDLENSINHTVDRIKQKIEHVKPPKWTFTPEEYYSSKEVLKVSDTKGFRTINKTCKVLFNAERNEVSKGSSASYFEPWKNGVPIFKGTELENHKLWFPKLALEKIDAKGNKKLVPATKKWLNTLSRDGKEIVEECKDRKKQDNEKKDNPNRIVFLKSRNSLGVEEYKFVGVFEFYKASGDKHYFKRIGDQIPIIK